MIPPNNPQIDTGDLARKLDSIEASRTGSSTASRIEPALVHLPQEPSAEFVDLTTVPNAAADSAPEPGPAPKTLPTSETSFVATKAARRSLLRSSLNWVKNLLRLNARLFSLNVRQERQQQELDALRLYFQQELDGLRLRKHELDEMHLRQQEGLEASQRALVELQVRVNQQMSNLATIDRRLAQFDHANIANRLNRFDALDISNRLNTFDTINIANRLALIETEMGAIAERNRERDNRVAALLETFAAASRVPSSTDAVPAGAIHAGQSEMDRFYLEFESKFRGEPSDIRERLKFYLPYVQALAVDPAAKVVDIGCGRGEWLELMRENGVHALGIDMNQAMVNACHSRGLQAECTDAIGWLRRQAPGSIALVTGFHLIEHLPFAAVLDLFDAALTALRPDGMVIFETPNPENIVVGACHFYYDPTHRNPIVPAVAEFIARQRGFAEAEIKRLNAYPDSYLLPEDTEMARRFNRAFYGPQDFAVIARKRHAD